MNATTGAGSGLVAQRPGLDVEQDVVRGGRAHLTAPARREHRLPLGLARPGEQVAQLARGVVPSSVAVDELLPLLAVVEPGLVLPLDRVPHLLGDAVGAAEL